MSLAVPPPSTLSIPSPGTSPVQSVANTPMANAVVLNGAVPIGGGGGGSAAAATAAAAAAAKPTVAATPTAQTAGMTSVAPHGTTTGGIAATGSGGGGGAAAAAAATAAVTIGHGHVTHSHSPLVIEEDETQPTAEEVEVFTRLTASLQESTHSGHSGLHQHPTYLRKTSSGPINSAAAAAAVSGLSKRGSGGSLITPRAAGDAADSKKTADPVPSTPHGTEVQKDMSQFFLELSQVDRMKWSEILQTFLILPWINEIKDDNHRISEAFLRTKDWQKKVMPLFVSDNELPPEAERRLFGISMSIFALLHFHRMATSTVKNYDDKPGAISMHLSVYGLLTQTIDAVDEFAGWHEDSVMLGRLMLYAVLNKVSAYVNDFKLNMLSPYWFNLFYVLGVIEQFIFYRPTRAFVFGGSSNQSNSAPGTPTGAGASSSGGTKAAGIHLDVLGHCVDLSLVEKALELLTVHLKVEKLTDLMLDTSDKRVSKYQKKWKERGMEWVEFLTKLNDYFKRQQEEKIDDKALSEFCHYLVKRKNHVPYKPLKQCLREFRSRVGLARKREAIYNSSLIARQLYELMSMEIDEDAACVSPHTAGAAHAAAATGIPHPVAGSHASSSLASSHASSISSGASHHRKHSATLQHTTPAAAAAAIAAVNHALGGHGHSGSGNNLVHHPSVSANQPSFSSKGGGNDKANALRSALDSIGGSSSPDDTPRPSVSASTQPQSSTSPVTVPSPQASPPAASTSPLAAASGGNASLLAPPPALITGTNAPSTLTSPNIAVLSPAPLTANGQQPASTSGPYSSADWTAPTNSSAAGAPPPLASAQSMGSTAALAAAALTAAVASGDAKHAPNSLAVSGASAASASTPLGHVRRVSMLPTEQHSVESLHVICALMFGEAVLEEAQFQNFGIHTLPTSSAGGRITPPAAVPTIIPTTPGGAAVAGTVHDPQLLSSNELRYLNAIKLVDNAADMQHFFDFLYKCDRAKWSILIETYLLRPLISGNSMKDGRHIAYSFLLGTHWQRWLLPLFVTYKNKLEPSEERRLFMCTLTVFGLVHYHHFCTHLPHGERLDAKDPYIKVPFDVTIGDLLREVDIFAGWHDDSVMLSRLLLMSVLNLICASAEHWKDDWKAPQWGNLFAFLDIIEQWIFYRPARLLDHSVDDSGNISTAASVAAHHTHATKTAGMHIDENGACEDMTMVEKILELLNTTLEVGEICDDMHPDTNTAKLQTSLSVRSNEYVEVYTQIFYFLLMTEEGRADNQSTQQFANFLAKRTHAHLPAPKLRHMCDRFHERVEQIRRKEAIANASHIAQSLYAHASTGAPGAAAAANPDPLPPARGYAHSRSSKRKQLTSHSSNSSAVAPVTPAASGRTLAPDQKHDHPPSSANGHPPLHPAVVAAAAQHAAASPSPSPRPSPAVIERKLSSGGSGVVQHSTPPPAAAKSGAGNAPPTATPPQQQPAAAAAAVTTTQAAVARPTATAAANAALLLGPPPASVLSALSPRGSLTPAQPAAGANAPAVPTPNAVVRSIAPISIDAALVASTTSALSPTASGGLTPKTVDTSTADPKARRVLAPSSAGAVSLSGAPPTISSGVGASHSMGAPAPFARLAAPRRSVKPSRAQLQTTFAKFMAPEATAAFHAAHHDPTETAKPQQPATAAATAQPALTLSAPSVSFGSGVVATSQASGAGAPAAFAANGVPLATPLPAGSRPPIFRHHHTSSTGGEHLVGSNAAVAHSQAHHLQMQHRASTGPRHISYLHHASSVINLERDTQTMYDFTFGGAVVLSPKSKMAKAMNFVAPIAAGSNLHTLSPPQQQLAAALNGTALASASAPAPAPVK